MVLFNHTCTIASKVNVASEGVYLPISKLYSILAIANLLAHYNNISQICYCGQILFQSFSDNLTPLGVTFVLLAMVYLKILLFFSVDEYSSSDTSSKSSPLCFPILGRDNQ